MKNFYGTKKHLFCAINWKSNMTKSASGLDCKIRTAKGTNQHYPFRRAAVQPFNHEIKLVKPYDRCFIKIVILTAWECTQCSWRNGRPRKGVSVSIKNGGWHSACLLKLKVFQCEWRKQNEIVWNCPSDHFPQVFPLKNILLLSSSDHTVWSCDNQKAHLPGIQRPIFWLKLSINNGLNIRLFRNDPDWKLRGSRMSNRHFCVETAGRLEMSAQYRRMF